MIEQKVNDALGSLGAVRRSQSLGITRYAPATIGVTQGESTGMQLARALQSVNPQIVQAIESVNQTQEKQSKAAVDKYLAQHDVTSLHEVWGRKGLPFQDNPVAMAYLKNRQAQMVKGSYDSKFQSDLTNQAEGFDFKGDDAALHKKYQEGLQAFITEQGLDPEDDATATGLAAGHQNVLTALMSLNQGMESKAKQAELHAVEKATIMSQVTPELMKKDPAQAAVMLQKAFETSRIGGALNTPERFNDMLSEVVKQAQSSGSPAMIELIGQMQDPFTKKSIKDSNPEAYVAAFEGASRRKALNDPLELGDNFVKLNEIIQNQDRAGLEAFNARVQADPILKEQMGNALIEAPLKMQQLALRQKEQQEKADKQQAAAAYDSKIAELWKQQVNSGMPLHDVERMVNPFTGKALTKAEFEVVAEQGLQAELSEAISKGASPEVQASITSKWVAQSGGSLNGWVQRTAQDGFAQLANSMRQAATKSDFKFGGQLNHALSQFTMLEDSGALGEVVLQPEQVEAMRVVRDMKSQGIPDGDIAQAYGVYQKRKDDPVFKQVLHFDSSKLRAEIAPSKLSMIFGKYTTNTGGKVFGDVITHNQDFADRILVRARTAILFGGLEGGTVASHMEAAVEKELKSSDFINGNPVPKSFLQNAQGVDKDSISEIATEAVRKTLAPLSKSLNVPIEQMVIEVSPANAGLNVSIPFYLDSSSVGGRRLQIPRTQLIADMQGIQRQRNADKDAKAAQVAIDRARGVTALGTATGGEDSNNAVSAALLGVSPNIAIKRLANNKTVRDVANTHLAPWIGKAARSNDSALVDSYEKNRSNIGNYTRDNEEHQLLESIKAKGEKSTDPRLRALYSRLKKEGKIK